MKPDICDFTLSSCNTELQENANGSQNIMATEDSYDVDGFDAYKQAIEDILSMKSVPKEFKKNKKVLKIRLTSLF